MANKFKIELKLTGLELKVEGSREDVPHMTQAVGQQIAGLLVPAANIVEGEIIQENQELAEVIPESKPKARRKRSARQSSQKSFNSSENGKVLALDWKHEPSKWGNPQQDWSTTKKSIWLLYVVQQETSTSALTNAQISNTFNKHFRQSKLINTSQINRDLGKAKLKKPAWVSEDTTKSPSVWCLTQEGEKYAQELVANALGQSHNT